MFYWYAVTFIGDTLDKMVSKGIVYGEDIFEASANISGWYDFADIESLQLKEIEDTEGALWETDYEVVKE